ncbi:MAG: MFS transporter, partial [Thermodesulfobacteriota bacterium]|nr:MFS transporter [Thermodesulfobacteriota bacterium]
MDRPTIKTDRSGYMALVRGNAPFRYLWFGQIVSLMGDWLNLIASATLVATLTQSGVAVGALFVVRWLAPFLISPVAGVAADRYDRRRLLILTDLGRGVVVLAFLFVQDAEDVWLLYSLTAIQLAMSGFFFPARNAILPNLVGAKELGTANALSSATWSVMLALGTGLGGLVAGALGVYAAFLIDALSFFLSALFIARISYHSAHGAERPDASIGTAMRQYVEGLRYLRHRLDILAIVLHKTALALTTSGALHVVQVALAKRVFIIGKGGAISMGIMFAVVGLGTGIGPIVARRFTGDRDRLLRIAIGLSFVMTAVGVAIAATLSSFGAVLAGILLRGIGGGTIWVFSTQLLMELVPNHIQGRVFATEFALFTLAGAISAAISGWSIDNP